MKPLRTPRTNRSYSYSLGIQRKQSREKKWRVSDRLGFEESPRRAQKKHFYRRKVQPCIVARVRANQRSVTIAVRGRVIPR